MVWVTNVSTTDNLLNTLRSMTHQMSDYDGVAQDSKITLRK
jgi:hypothetical protein